MSCYVGITANLEREKVRTPQRVSEYEELAMLGNLPEQNRSTKTRG